MVTIKQKYSHLPDGSIDLSTWLKILNEHYHLKNPKALENAIQFIDHICKGLTTFYGKPCIEQSLEIAEMIFELNQDTETAIAAMLTTVVQHANVKLETVQTEFDPNIGKLVSGSSQMNFINNLANLKTRNVTQIDRLRKTLLALASDIRVVLINLAERTCLMRGIKNINSAERKRLAQETMDLYAPLANRLGIGQLKWELEDLSFHYINPEAYKTIATFLAERRVDRENRIHTIIHDIKQQLQQINIHSEVTGRAKHIYSIYLKMQRKHLDYKNIYDASAIRILVPTIEDCYKALSIVHQWEHISEEFDDYISNPKPNGYRSIHTAVVGPDNKNMEIQIRTFDMHDEAEHGIAAHWIYKENKPQAGYESKIVFLRQLLAWHKDIAKDEESIEKLNQQILEDRVYAFTPAGEILDLPVGATPLDFAYHIHSNLGHRCRGAKVNGHIVPLSYSLKTGDQVEVITIKEGNPSRDWLSKDTGYVKTPRARAKIAQWFRQQEVQQYVESGRQFLEKELSRAGILNPNLQKIAALFNFKEDDALFAAIGHGVLRAAQVIHALQGEHKPSHAPPAKKSTPTSPNLQIAGTDDLLTRIARCCKPIPGDSVIGYITQGRGISIHRKTCNNILHANQEKGRFLEVTWDPQQSGSYLVDLKIQARGKENIINDISAILPTLKIDLIALNSTISKKNNMIYINMTIQIREANQLKTLLTTLQHMRNVIFVKRMRE